MTARFDWRKALPWAFYDWANSAYAVTVLTGLFPIFFKDYWNPGGTAEVESTFRLGRANSLASSAGGRSDTPARGRPVVGLLLADPAGTTGGRFGMVSSEPLAS